LGCLCVQVPLQVLEAAPRTRGSCCAWAGAESRHAIADNIAAQKSLLFVTVQPSCSWALFFRLFPDWPESVVENKVAHLIALFDALLGVELPMYAQVSRLCAFSHSRLAKRFERGWPEGALMLPSTSLLWPFHSSETKVNGVSSGQNWRRIWNKAPPNVAWPDG
jgi:hypothetical protein